MKTAAFIALSLLLGSTNAFATLGAPDGRAAAERLRGALHGTRTVQLLSGYEIDTIVTEGNTIREYISSSGTVFCVAWSGMSRPDLTQIFGPYYAEYAEAERSTVKPKGRTEMTIASQNLRVAHGGHMRAIRGRACIPALVPSGFDLVQVQ